MTKIREHEIHPQLLSGSSKDMEPSKGKVEHLPEKIGQPITNPPLVWINLSRRIQQRLIVTLWNRRARSYAGGTGWQNRESTINTCSRQNSVVRGDKSEVGEHGKVVTWEAVSTWHATMMVEGVFESLDKEKNVLWSLDMVSTSSSSSSRPLSKSPSG